MDIIVKNEEEQEKNEKSVSFAEAKDTSMKSVRRIRTLDFRVTAIIVGDLTIVVINGFKKGTVKKS